MEQNENTLSVLKIAPGQYPQQVEIDNNLKALQEAVGGTIAAVYPFADPVAIICNDDGTQVHNRRLYGLGVLHCAWAPLLQYGCFHWQHLAVAPVPGHAFIYQDAVKPGLHILRVPQGGKFGNAL